VVLDDNSIFIGIAYYNSIKEDLKSIFDVFDTTIVENYDANSQGHLRIPSFYNNNNNLDKLLYYFILKSLKFLIEENFVPANITNISLIDYTKDALFRFNNLPINGYTIFNNIIITHKHNFDIYDKPENSNKIYGAVIPSNSFAWKGNEYNYSSINSMAGNNSTLRITQVPARNQFMYILDNLYIGF